MACRLDETAAAALWGALRSCRNHLRHPEGVPAGSVCFRRQHGGWSFHAEGPLPGVEGQVVVPLAPASAVGPEAPGPPGITVFRYDRFRRGEPPFEVDGTAALDAATLAVFRVYLPLLLGPFFARHESRPFVSAHLAQTLDGRIACANGHSQWISNEANLRHAHRLRALHDAVAVGRHTVERDNPQLNVRHVAGEHPRRVVLNASASLLAEEHDYHVFDERGSTVVCHRSALATLPPRGDHRHVEVLPIDGEAGALLCPREVGEALARRGLHSIFLEGGARTVSRFFQDGAIDVLHVHVAPLVLGSGIESFTLPEVQHIGEGRRLICEHFLLDGEILIECIEAGGQR